MSTEVVKFQSAAVMQEQTVDEVMEQIQKIKSLMASAMKEGEHYGTIPGTKKPTLYKAGAEKLALMFRLAPTFEILQTDLPRNHREYRIVCSITNINSGSFLGSGVGCCTTMESKYRYRNSERTCPNCGAAAITKGKDQYGGGWFCWKKKGGCGATWTDDDPMIASQTPEKVEHSDPADFWNTILKMAKKRAMNDAIISSTAVSDCFIQADDLPADKGPKGSEGPNESSNPREEPAAHSEPQQGSDTRKDMTDGQARALSALMNRGVDRELHDKIESVLEKGATFQDAAALIGAAQETK